MRPNSAKLAKYRVFCGYTWENPGIPATWKIPGILPISQILVRFCFRSRGKYYHHLIVLAVECLIVLGGYTSKSPALWGATCAARAVCCCLTALSLLQISSRAGRPLANANGRRQGGRRCCAAGSSRGSSQRLLFLHIRLPFSPSTALCPQLSHPWIPPHFPNTARSGRDSSFTLVE